MAYAVRRLGEAIGLRRRIAPRELLVRDAILLGVGQVGHRISKWANYGLSLLFDYLGDTIGGDVGLTFKQWKEVIARSVTGIATVLALLFVTRPYVRIIAFGSAWEHVTYAVDKLEEYVISILPKPS